MRNLLDRYRLPNFALEGDGGGGGDKGGGGGGGGGDDKGGGGGGGGGDDKGGGGEKSDAPWYTNKDFGLAADVDLVKHLEGKKFPGLKDALTAGMHADRVARSRDVMDNPDPNNMKAWKGWEKLGWTPEVDKYTFDKPKLKEGAEYDFGMEDHLRKTAHEERIPLGAAKKLRDAMVDYNAGVADRLAATGAAETAALQRELDTKWGADKEKNLGIAKAAMKASGLNVDDAKILEQLMGAPGLIAHFHKLGSELGEDRLAGGGAGGGGGPHSPEAARAELTRLQADRSFMDALRDERNPRHAEVEAQRAQLIELIAKGERRAA